MSDPFLELLPRPHFLSFIFHTIPSMLRLYRRPFDPKKGREKLILRQIYFTLLL